jgi:hypothetical protein
MTTTASVSKRSRRCKNGYRNMSRSLVAPKSGMVSEIGGNTVITFVAGNVGWPRKGQRNRGKWAPAPAATGPGEGRGRGRDPGRPPSASRACPHHASCQTKPQTTASLALSQFRFPPKVSCPARNTDSRPFIILRSGPLLLFLFCYGGRRGGDGEQQYTLFCHDVEIFPPKMTKK